MLADAGWVQQDRSEFDRNAGVGVAVREFQLPAGACDYLLFVDGKAAGVIEAKKTGVTLSGVAEQSAKYMVGPPPHLARGDFDDFIHCYRARQETERFRRFSYDELARRDKLNLDIFWLKDEIGRAHV